MTAKQLITISRHRAYRICPRYHHLSYDLCFEPVDEEHGAKDFGFGTAGHAGLEAWLLAIKDGRHEDALEAARSAAVASARASDFDAWEIERDRKSTRLNSSHLSVTRMPSSA